MYKTSCEKQHQIPNDLLLVQSCARLLGNDVKIGTVVQIKAAKDTLKNYKTHDSAFLTNKFRLLIIW